MSYSLGYWEQRPVHLPEIEDFMTSGNALSKQALSETTAHAIEAVRSELVEVALDIHAHPELNYQDSKRVYHYILMKSSSIHSN